jgi:nucleoside-diphosphate-sugar epimerase
MTTVVTGASGFLGSALVTELVKRSRVQFLTHSRIYDCSRAKFEMGFMPKVSLEEGMKLTAAWYYKHHYLDDPSRSRRTV